VTVSREELQKAYAEAARTIGTGSKSAFAEMIVQLIQPNHLSLDIFNEFMPVTQLMPGDNVMRRVRKGKYKVRSMVPGTMHLTSQTTFQDQYAYMFDRLIAGIKHSLWEIESGDIGTVENMRKELRADITDEIVSRVFSLLGSVWNATDTPLNYFDASSGGVTATVLDSAIENVVDEAGTVRAIIGTRKALLPIYKFAGYVEYALTGTGTDRVGFPTSALDEFYRTNKVSTYHGVRLVELPNVRRHRLPGYQDKLLDTTKVVVVGDNAGSIALMDTFKEQDFTDARTQPAEYTLHGWQAFSMLVDMAENLAVIKVAAS
jgi:hypothetical protein